MLKRYGRTVGTEKLDKLAKKLKQTADKLANLKSLDELRGAEGLAAKIYFATFADLLDQSRWKWRECSQHPARNPVNALLNYGYAFLEREVRIAAALNGMDARIGFFHANDGRLAQQTNDSTQTFHVNARRVSLNRRRSTRFLQPLRRVHSEKIS